MRWIVVAGALALAGCQSGPSGPSEREMIAAMDADKAACRVAGHRTRLALARCLNQAESPVFNTGAPADLLAIRFASRLSIAERQDKGQLTEAQAELEFAQSNSRLVSEETARSNASRGIAAQQGVANAQASMARSQNDFAAQQRRANCAANVSSNPFVIAPAC